MRRGREGIGQAGFVQLPEGGEGELVDQEDGVPVASPRPAQPDRRGAGRREASEVVGQEVEPLGLGEAGGQKGALLDRGQRSGDHPGEPASVQGVDAAPNERERGHRSPRKGRQQRHLRAAAPGHRAGLLAPPTDDVDLRCGHRA